MKFMIGTRWIVYDNEVQSEHMVVDHEPIVGLLITECNGERYQWHPEVLIWLADPMETVI